MSDAPDATSEALPQWSRPEALGEGLYKHALSHPDGRPLYLYSRSAAPLAMPARGERQLPPGPHLRWHALRGEWVMVAAHRQERTFMPPPEYCPLCPTKEGMLETEIPFPSFDIAVFENKFPSLAPHAPDPERAGMAAGRGVCEVIVYSDKHDKTTASLTDEEMQALVLAWRDRTGDLAAKEGVAYVLIFENRGEEVGVTLTHPHGQIYAYPFVPPYIERERSQVQAQGDILGTVVEDREGSRLVFENADWLVLVPFWARYPFETYVLPKTFRANLLELEAGEQNALAEALGVIIRGYDRLFAKTMPYVMAIQQAPRPAGAWRDYRMRVEFLPRQRAPNKLKYLAGTEVAAGAFAVDALAEDYAKRLREVIE